MAHSSSRQPHRVLVSLCTFLVTMACIASQASAQDRKTTIIFTPGLTSTTTTGVVITVIDSTTSSTSTTRDVLFGSKDGTTAYMAQNATALKQSLTLGDGEALDDLAHMARIEPEDILAFKGLMRTHRATLVELLSAPDFGQTQAMAMTEIITAAMREDAKLEHYVADAAS